MTFKVPNKYRVKVGPMGTTDEAGNNGAFELPHVVPGRPLRAIASDGGGWEHVSVTIPGRKVLVPTWNEMSYVKGLFWSPETAVMELHPPRDRYVSNHDGCLHLWRPIDAEIPLPPANMVGVVGQTHEQTKAVVSRQALTALQLALALGWSP